MARVASMFSPKAHFTSPASSTFMGGSQTGGAGVSPGISKQKKRTLFWASAAEDVHAFQKNIAVKGRTRESMSC